jgi:hypothetical protein
LSKPCLSKNLIDNFKFKDQEKKVFTELVVDLYWLPLSPMKLFPDSIPMYLMGTKKKIFNQLILHHSAQSSSKKSKAIKVHAMTHTWG